MNKRKMCEVCGKRYQWDFAQCPKCKSEQSEMCLLSWPSHCKTESINTYCIIVVTEKRFIALNDTSIRRDLLSAILRRKTIDFNLTNPIVDIPLKSIIQISKETEKHLGFQSLTTIVKTKDLNEFVFDRFPKYESNEMRTLIDDNKIMI